MGWGPNTEAGGKSAYNNVQVGGGPNIENFVKKFYRQCKLAESQHNKSLVVLYLFCLTPLTAT
ncbi:hypothetical protein D8062_08340 [Staphylococcus aureus]|nr:hypothetical protein C9J90_05260 [Staphylococcus aureus]MQL15060.1 hypothetical protein [Escherichia coli]AXS23681.1 hypothetical protein D1G35_03920 [Staphylococcus aureus]AXS26410.1 hypothetical protein D1O27_03625 [Staphylococcus aureus]QAZ53082.1 hypothetical protein CHN55_03670 [Staphylococcus aureus]